MSRVLCLGGLTLAVIACASSTSQAEVGSAWMVNGSNVVPPLNPTMTSVEENEIGSLLTTILGISTKISCKTTSIANTLGGTGSVNEGKVKFSGCATFLKGSATASAPCLPKTAGVGDVIQTDPLLGLIVLVGGVGEILIKGLEGKPLAVIESSEECAIGQKIKITGEIYIKDCQNNLATELVTHLFEADNVNSTLKASNQGATIDGSNNISLNGAHAGLRWSGLPA